MRYGTVCVALVCLLVAGRVRGAENERPEMLVRWHFAGTEQLKKLKDQKALQSMLDLPETAALREAAFTAFSARASARFAKEGDPNPSERGPQIKELLPDLLRFETSFLLVGSPGAEAEWALGIRLPQDREATWRKQLGELARGSGLTINEGPDWSAKGNKYRLALKREGDWIFLRGGYTQNEKEGRAIADFRNELGRKTGKEVLLADLNLPKLGDLWKAPRLSHAPRVVIKGTPDQDGLRSEVQLEYGRDLGIKPEKWNFPAKLFREPLVGFTAIQGVAEALRNNPHIQALGFSKVPNQLFGWSVGDTPFSMYVAADVGNPKEVVNTIIDKVIPEIKQKAGPMLSTQPQISSNRTRVAWRGALPVVVPFAEAASGPAANFLVMGLLPVAVAGTNQIPTELLDELKKKNLVYYEWEITEARLQQWRPAWQVLQMAFPEKALRTHTPSEQWLAAITPKLGNTVTEATLENQRKIRVIRQSHIGFNALELVLLAHWLDPNDVRELRPGAGGSSTGQKPVPPNAETGR